MSDHKLSRAELLDLLDTIIAESPQKEETLRYCVYRVDELANRQMRKPDTGGSPANCIAGETIYRLGGLEALNALRENSVISVSPDILRLANTGVMQNSVINSAIADKFLEPEAIVALRRVQQDQDSGRPWGAAVETERNRVEAQV